MTDFVNAVGVKAIAIALRDFPLSIADKVGAWKIINSIKEDPVERALEYTSGFGVDTVFLQVGGKNPNPLIQAIKMIKKGGKVMIVGLPTGLHSLKEFNLDLLRDERSIQFVNNLSYWGEYSENKIALDFMTRGKLHPEELITHRFPLEKINEAFDVAAQKKHNNSIKVMIIQ